MPGSGSLLYSSDYSSLAGFLAFSLSHGTVIHQQFCWPSFKTHPALTTCPRLHHHSSQSTLLASPPELPYYFQTALPAAVPARHAMLSKMVLLNIGHAILLQPPITPAWQKKKKIWALYQESQVPSGWALGSFVNSLLLPLPKPRPS